MKKMCGWEIIKTEKIWRRKNKLLWNRKYMLCTCMPTFLHFWTACTKYATVPVSWDVCLPVVTIFKKHCYFLMSTFAYMFGNKYRQDKLFTLFSSSRNWNVKQKQKMSQSEHTQALRLIFYLCEHNLILIITLVVTKLCHIWQGSGKMAILWLNDCILYALDQILPLSRPILTTFIKEVFWLK